MRCAIKGRWLAFVGLMALAGPPARAQNLSLPFRADDFADNERMYTKMHAAGDQALGKDIRVYRQLEDGSWSRYHPGKDGSKNADHLIYGKPIHAMADGEVIAGWRNAPDNPAPGETHPKRLEKLIGGGGNFVKVRHDDGRIVLYAHAQPGTVPANLAPTGATYYSKPDNGKESEFPAGKGPRIKKGQFLGKVGNSGASSGPHLHVHIIKDGKASPMVFERGMAVAWNGGEPDVQQWKRFAGSTIPDGEVLIWPPHTLQAEYSRGKVPAGDFGPLFDHLLDSGYAPVWLDGYSVGQKAFLNAIWRPAQGSWRAYFGLTEAQHNERVAERTKAGFSLIHVDSYEVNNAVRYASIFRQGAGQSLTKTNLTQAQHQALLESAKQQGLEPVNVAVVSVKGERRYTVLYRNVPIGAWELKSQMTEAQYQKAAVDAYNAGRTILYANPYLHDKAAYFSVIVADKPADKWKGLHGLTPSALDDEAGKAYASKFLTRFISGYDGAQANHRFVAVWEK